MDTEFLSKFKDSEISRSLSERLIKLSNDMQEMWDGRPLRLMEVCGTHTVAIARSGLRSILPENIRLISGPGCPVCRRP